MAVMSHESKTESPAEGAESVVASVIIEIGGGFECYPEHQALLDGSREVARYIARRVKVFFALPAGAEGGFLQPPTGSHFGRDFGREMQ
jgi:hypothetical protein